MQSHYDTYHAYHETPGPSDRAVGIVLAVALAIIGFFPLWRGRAPREWALGAGAALLAAALLRPRLLIPITRAWVRLGLLMGRVVNFVVLAALFYLVVTPLALLLRMLGKDQLRLRAAPSAATYWLERVPPGPAPEGMADQF